VKGEDELLQKAAEASFKALKASANPGIDPLAQPFIDRYETPPNEIKRAKRLRSLIGTRKFKNLLDIGCGNGFVTRYFTDCVANIYGVDVQEKIEYIRKVLPQGKFAELNLATLEPKDEKEKYLTNFMLSTFGVDKFDLILCTDVMQYLPNRPFIAANILEMLDEQGILLMSRHTPKPDERRVERVTMELAGFWLLREEHFDPHSVWILSAWTRYPPVVNIAANMGYVAIPNGDVNIHVDNSVVKGPDNFSGRAGVY
jgi:2-polyprenyl-3-methyl-5-hydroxy-6-metoxy-1,4-benzoquinol methylase